jgi:hypothetical protein
MSRTTRISGASAVSSSCADLAERSACIRVEPRVPLSRVFRRVSCTNRLIT